MVSTILVYASLLFQIVAAAIAISLFKRTKFNGSWILISTGFILMVVSRIVDFLPAAYPEYTDELAIFQRWLTFVISAVFVVGVFYIRKIFQFMRRVDAIRKEAENKVLSAVIRTEEQERRHFAKELHDGLGPLLSVVKMLVSGLGGQHPAETDAPIRQNLRQAVDEAIVCVRDISVNISPHILDNFGLREAVDAFVKRLRPAEGIDISFDTNIGNRRFSYNTEVIMYRVICELINNTLRHAEAKRIEIKLEQADKTLRLAYNDDGIGFNVNREATRYGMGLDNMRHRLRSGNGDLEIESERGKGMQARAFLKI